MIEQAIMSNLGAIKQLADKTRKHMLSIGLQQWLGDYPALIDFQADLEKNGLYVFKKNNQIYGSISILEENDPAYQAITWSNQEALVVHRLFVDPDHQKEGLGKALFAFAQSMALNNNKSLKVDTHPDNLRMQLLIKKMGFEYKGYLASIHRYAYEWLNK